MKIDFNKIVDDDLTKKRELNKKNRTEGIHASSLGQCLRKQWYEIKCPIEHPNDTLRIFQIGNMLHEYMTELIPKNEDVASVRSEQPIKILLEPPGCVIHGTYDDLVRFKDGKAILIDEKSAKNLFYITKPKKEHLMQLMLYMKVLGVEDGQISYIGKNDFQIKDFPVKFDEALYREAVERAKKLHYFLMESVLPPAEAKEDPSKKWLCDYCLHRKLCDKNKRNAHDK